MNRAEAMAFADQLVTGWIDNPPKNDRGYTRDGWKTPSLKERTDAVEQLASFLWEVEGPVPVRKLVAPAIDTVFGWPVDGRHPPTAGQYAIATATLTQWESEPNVVHRVDEIHALHALVNAYERAN